MSQGDLFSTLNLREARLARDEGMKRVMKGAEKSDPDWSENAYAFLLQFISQNDRFMTEDVRVASFGAVAPPPNLKAWGPVVLRAARANLIRVEKYKAQRSISCHGSPKPVWIRI